MSKLEILFNYIIHYLILFREIINHCIQIMSIVSFFEPPRMPDSNLIFLKLKDINPLTYTNFKPDKIRQLIPM